MAIVDIHCHTFNADDLPVKGFVKRVAGNRSSLARALGWSLDKIVQGMSSGADERARLDRLLEAGPSAAGGFAPEAVLAQADVEADELLEELLREDRELAERAGAEAAEDADSTTDAAVGPESIGSRLEELRRYLKWAALFGKDRLELTRTLIDLYGEVDLFTPMLVDLQGLEDKAETTVLEQLELQERLSRLSILGHFDAQVLPFVGLDPRSANAVPLAQRAVAEFGCVGVKLYPPMGFRPIGNVDDPPAGMSQEVAHRVDDALTELYTWCSEKDVPITAHSNPTQYAREEYRLLTGPANWRRVLEVEAWRGLHLNLGHFGWAGWSMHWPQLISEMMATFPGLYADIGNHDVRGIGQTMDRFDDLFRDPATSTLEKRIMFGTDWYMLANHHEFERFLTAVRKAFDDRFAEHTDSFMGGAALTFLGFDEPTNQNNVRVRERYARLDVPAPDWLKT